MGNFKGAMKEKRAPAGSKKKKNSNNHCEEGTWKNVRIWKSSFETYRT
jgi:hypothetical protein